MADNECLVLTWLPKATNIEILMNLKKKVYPKIDNQIKVHMIKQPNIARLPSSLNLKQYKSLYFMPAEYTYTKFTQHSDISSMYNGKLLNFNGWNQLSKLILNSIWDSYGVDVPDSIKLSRSTDLTLIPESFYPAVIFSYVGHAGAGRHTKVNSAEEIKTWFRTYPEKNLVMLQKFIDFKHDDYYYKCRVIKMGDELLPIYTHRAKKWLWHINPTQRDLAEYKIIDFDLSWFENKIGKENFWNGVKKITEPLAMDNYAIDICLNENMEVVPFEITVPYARNIVKIEDTETFEGDFNCGCNHWVKFLQMCGVEFDVDDFTKTVREYVLTHGSLR